MMKNGNGQGFPNMYNISYGGGEDLIQSYDPSKSSQMFKKSTSKMRCEKNTATISKFLSVSTLNQYLSLWLADDCIPWHPTMLV